MAPKYLDGQSVTTSDLRALAGLVEELSADSPLRPFLQYIHWELSLTNDLLLMELH